MKLFSLSLGIITGWSCSRKGRMYICKRKSMRLRIVGTHPHRFDVFQILHVHHFTLDELKNYSGDSG